MKITFEQLHASWDALNRLVASRPEDPLVATRLRRLWRIVKPEYDAVVEGLVPIMLRHGAEQVGDKLIVPPAQLAAFQEQTRRLFAEEIELPEIRINVADLPRGVCSALDLETLDWLITEEAQSQ